MNLREAIFVLDAIANVGIQKRASIFPKSQFCCGTILAMPSL